MKEEKMMKYIGERMVILGIMLATLLAVIYNYVIPMKITMNNVWMQNVFSILLVAALILILIGIRSSRKRRQDN